MLLLVMLAPGLESRELTVSFTNNVIQHILQAIEPDYGINPNDLLAPFIK